ncbi:hypothetical protein EDD18DRAFT_1091597, partial [Armillaria luteobubalina]
TDLDRHNLLLINNCIYLNQILHINYMTYDVQRNQDSINPCTHSDIMMLTCEDSSDDQSHSYLYARVIGIFHVIVQLVGTWNSSSKNNSAKKMEFLWVHWYSFDTAISSGFKARCLPCLGFLSEDDPEAFGFIDPRDVICASHIVLAYHYGQTQDILPPSICR